MRRISIYFKGDLSWQQTVTNTEALGNKISELQTLHDTWADKTYTAVDIGECGGSTIIQIEEMGNMFQRMQDAYVTLLAQTISYMTNRKESLDTKESNATATVSE